jgi:uncharacterized repeat protein (TIGR01451 family)
MFGRIALATLVTSVCVCGASMALAQDTDDSQPRRLPTLSERLQQFRQDLVGDPPAAVRKASADDTPPADRKVANRPSTSSTARQRSAVVQRNTVKPNNNADASVTTESTVISPPRLKPQSARRAQPAPGASAIASEEADDEASVDAAPPRLPSRRAPSVLRRTKIEEEQDDEAPKAEPRAAKAVPVPIQTRDLHDVDADEPVRPVPSRRPAGTGVLFATASPALSVEATGPRKVLIGREAHFVVKVRNSGAPANNLIVTVNLPSYAEVTALDGSAGSVQPPAPGERREPLEWKISRMEAHSEETLNIKLVPRKSTPLDLAVQCAFTPEASQTLVEVQEPKLVMMISGPDEVLFGESKMYKLTLSNPGNGDTENVTVALSPLGRGSEGGASHRVGTLRAGESKSIDIELTARQAGAVTIKAQAFADGGLRTEAAEQILVRRANLRIEVEAPRVKYAGTVGTYHVKVINAGNATAENVQLSAMLPPDAKFVSTNGGGRLDEQQGKVNWAVGTLQPGGQRVFETHCSLIAPGENRTQFVAVAEGDLSAAATSTTHVEAMADLKLEVRDPQGPIAVGEEAVYEVHVRNRGTKAAEHVDLAIFFSEGLEAVSAEGGAHEIAPGQVVFKPITSLGAGDTAVFRVRSRAERSGTHRFRAEVLCQSLHTKLAAEETTHFYGDDRAAGQDQPAGPLPRRNPASESDAEPAPLEQAPQANP